MLSLVSKLQAIRAFFILVGEHDGEDVGASLTHLADSAARVPSDETERRAKKDELIG
ncbi:MAG: hypothetical protein JO223_07135 [Hyphomicrobiales bacterium]|nr:hypothetical protein [Hyphomicrobiales bacterium]MBV8442882.1 hypothetical protein [Hyphomicrobiales bacterium]